MDGGAGRRPVRLEFTGPNRQFANPNGVGADPVNGVGGTGGGFLVGATSISAPIPPGVPDGIYQLRVIGVSAGGQAIGSFRDALTLILENPPRRPTMIAPPAGTRLQPGTVLSIAWTGVFGATQYGIEVSGVNRAFANPNGVEADPINGFGGAGGGLLVNGTSLTAVVPASLAPGNLRTAGDRPGPGRCGRHLQRRHHPGRSLNGRSTARSSASRPRIAGGSISPRPRRSSDSMRPTWTRFSARSRSIMTGRADHGKAVEYLVRAERPDDGQPRPGGSH